MLVAIQGVRLQFAGKRMHATCLDNKRLSLSLYLRWAKSPIANRNQLSQAIPQFHVERMLNE